MKPTADIIFSAEVVDFNATEFNVWGETPAGVQWFADHFGGAVEACCVKSALQEICDALDAAGLTHAVEV